MSAGKQARPKASVIVPVYNVERYIRRTVESLLGQDAEDVEVILVDDGSPDECPGILDGFADEDSRVRVIHQANAGVSAARNTGIAAATGEWILFVDGDDWVDTDYVSHLVRLVEEQGCRVGMNRGLYRAGGGIRSAASTGTLPRLRAMEEIYLGSIDVAVWNKIYSAELIREAGLRFCPEVWYGEGMLFNIEALQLVDRVAVTGRALYHQVFNPASAMRAFNLVNQECGLRSLDLQRFAWKESDVALERAWEYHRWAYCRSTLAGLWNTGAAEENRRLWNGCVRDLRRGLDRAFKVPIGARERLGWIAWALTPTLMAKRGSAHFERFRE